MNRPQFKRRPMGPRGYAAAMRRARMLIEQIEHGALRMEAIRLNSPAYGDIPREQLSRAISNLARLSRELMVRHHEGNLR